MTVQMSRHGEQEVVEHDPVRQESSLDFIRGSLRCSESVVLDVMCVSPNVERLSQSFISTRDS